MGPAFEDGGEINIIRIVFKNGQHSSLKQPPSAVARFNFGGLWVSQKYRGRGIGRTLAQMVVDKALESGAKTMYVSATPSENTVRFYKSIGFRLATPVDPGMFEREPEDIHLELPL